MMNEEKTLIELKPALDHQVSSIYEELIKGIELKDTVVLMTEVYVNMVNEGLNTGYSMEMMPYRGKIFPMYESLQRYGLGKPVKD